MKKQLMLSVIVLVIAALVTGCTNAAGPDNSEEPRVTEITVCENWGFEDGFFTVATPGNSANLGLSFYLSNFYDTLVGVKNGELVPGLAKSWNVSDDGLVYTFDLKEGIKFSDGSELNAAVVKRNLEMIPIMLGDFNGTAGVITTLFQEIIEVDDYTVEVRLTAPYYGGLQEFANPMPMSIMSASAFTEDNTFSDKIRATTLGTGPYMFESKTDNSYSFVLNPYYTGAKPEVERFNIKVIPDNESKALALRSGEVDLIFGYEKIGYSRFNELAGNPDFAAVTSESAIKTRLLGFNMTREPVNDIRVRKAIAHALDKQDLCASLLYGLDTKADTALSQSLPYCNVPVEPYEFNLQQADALLKEAGWQDLDGDGIREKNGQKLTLDFLYTTGSSTVEDIVLAIKAALENIGMEINVSGRELLAAYAETQQGNYTITYKKTYGHPYDPFMFISNMDSELMADNVLVQGFNHVENGNQLIRDMVSMVDQQEIGERYEMILNELHDNVSFVPLTEMKELAVYNSQIITDYKFFEMPSILNIAEIKLK